MDKPINPSHQLKFELAKKEDEQSGEYWTARELSAILEYSDFRNFENAIEKAKIACENSGQKVLDHFGDVTEMVEIGSGAKREVKDYILSRYACYLVI